MKRVTTYLHTSDIGKTADNKINAYAFCQMQNKTFANRCYSHLNKQQLTTD